MASESTLTVGRLVFTSIVGAILAFSVVSNIVVIVVVVTTPFLRTPIHLLICNLAVSDLILVTLVLPQHLHNISRSKANYYGGDFLCRMVYTLPLLCAMVSIYTMVAISFERAQAIMLVKANKLTFRTAVGCVVLIWFMAILLSLPTALEYSEYSMPKDENTTTMECESHDVSYVYQVVNGAVLVLLAYIIPLAVLFYNYQRILLFIRMKGMFGKLAAQKREVFQALFKTRITVVKMLILVTAIFALCWAPYFGLLLWEKIATVAHDDHVDRVPNKLKIIFLAFSTAHNFVLYVAYNRNFRLGTIRLLQVLKCARCFGTVAQVRPTEETDSDFVTTPTMQMSASRGR